MIIRAIIVDDEVLGRKNLRGILLEHYPQVQLVGEASSVKDAIELIQNQKPELVFLDIEMPEANGFELLENFENYSFEVIFVTAYDSYAIKAIRFSAVDYILKPIDYNELNSAVGKAVKQIQLKNENYRLRHLYHNIKQPQQAKIGLPTLDRVEFVEVDKIIYCQSEGSYTHIYLTEDIHYFVCKNIGEFEELLNDYSFIRVHKTHLVNLKHVVAYVKIDGGALQMSNGLSISVSRRRKDIVLQE